MKRFSVSLLIFAIITVTTVVLAYAEVASQGVMNFLTYSVIFSFLDVVTEAVILAYKKLPEKNRRRRQKGQRIAN
jgi:hypothetical protein